jgi:predicted RNA binding protein YcfA (HicA-like mRNA interferase family)
VTKDLARVLKAAVKRGWTLTRGKHWILDHPAGGRVVVAISPSCWRAILNTQARIERIERHHQGK